ncbi:MAG TPA: cyclic nucleotide-binding domain-containing protein, partial [Deltaproteobacteria bacterium]|nr:cyclic nucleotide-binding domain-containing protein [Deltaproteobacteria bacterium]
MSSCEPRPYPGSFVTSYAAGVSFLDAFEPSHRTLLEGAAQRVVLRRGAHLLRRGEPGGDVFLLCSGVLEVVDSRSTPEVILNSLKEGAVVGEMAFIDDAPRSADVRSATECTVLRWRRDELSQLLRKHPGVSASFYEWVARMATARIRVLTDGAVAGAYGKGGGAAGSDDARDWAHRIVIDLKEALQPLETALRQAPDDGVIRARVRAVLDHLEARIEELFSAHRDPTSSALATAQLRREVHPYLARAAIADRALRRGEG